VEYLRRTHESYAAFALWLPVPEHANVIPESAMERRHGRRRPGRCRGRACPHVAGMPTEALPRPACGSICKLTASPRSASGSAAAMPRTQAGALLPCRRCTDGGQRRRHLPPEAERHGPRHPSSARKRAGCLPGSSRSEPEGRAVEPWPPTKYHVRKRWFPGHKSRRYSGISSLMSQQGVSSSARPSSYQKRI
jgi:hypothetical protein